MALQKRFNDPRKQFVDPYWTIISGVLSHGRGRPKTHAATVSAMGFAAGATQRLKYLHCFLILHSPQEPLTEGRINTISLRQRPLAPLFDFFD